MVACDVSAHPRRRVGDDAVERVSSDKPRAREFIHRQVIVRCPVGHPVSDDAGRRAVRNAHPITDHDDDVLDRMAVVAPKIVVERFAIRVPVFIVVERFADSVFDLDDPEFRAYCHSSSRVGEGRGKCPTK